METFNTFKNGFASLGFDSPQSTHEDLLKINNILSVLLFAISLLSTCAYVYYEASSFEEYIDSVFMLSGLTIVLFMFANFFWQMPNFYRFFVHLENTIEKSECNR